MHYRLWLRRAEEQRSIFPYIQTRLTGGDIDPGRHGAIAIDRINFITGAKRVDTIYKSIASKSSIGRLRRASVILWMELEAS